QSFDIQEAAVEEPLGICIIIIEIVALWIGDHDVGPALTELHVVHLETDSLAGSAVKGNVGDLTIDRHGDCDWWSISNYRIGYRLRNFVEDPRCVSHAVAGRIDQERIRSGDRKLIDVVRRGSSVVIGEYCTVRF